MRQFAVIGLGEFGLHLVRTLAKGDVEVLAIDNNKDHINAIKDEVSHAVQLDSTNEEALSRVGIEEMDVAVVAIGKNLQDNILTTALLKRLGVPVIVSRSQNHIHAQILREIGATKIINPEQDMGVRIGQQLLIPHLQDSVELSEGYVLADIRTPKEFYGKSLKDLALRSKYRVNIVAIKTVEKTGRRATDKLILKSYNGLPVPEDVLEENSVLVITGKREDVETLAVMESD